MCFSTIRARPVRLRHSFLDVLLAGLLLALPLFSTTVEAGYQLDPTSSDSIKDVASNMAEDMMSFYTGNQPGGTPGLLPQPYYWWEAGALMGALIDYWHYAGDSKYNDITKQGLLFQVGPNNDFMPPNQTLTEGNDDQGFWGMAVMTAAEYNFPNPPDDQPQWLALAQAVFNTQAARWDSANCGGGLRWQIFTWNNGFDYKNSISQACFFNLASRLALYTGNQSYADWAERTWDWMRAVKFLDDNYYVYDGAHTESNCSQITPYQFSYNAGAFLVGAAAMYNYSSQTNDQDKASTWKKRVDGLLKGTEVFFTGDDNSIMTETACESVNLCDLDEQSFKAYLSRWMAVTTQWAPWTYETILPLLQASAKAAASQCSGGDNGRMCGLKWTDHGTWDGSSGVGQQMSALEVTLAAMVQQVAAPVTSSTGGTSKGDPNAGGGDVGRTDPWTSLELMQPVRAGDRIGAALLTLVVLLGAISGAIFMIMDETIKATPAERWHSFVSEVGKGGKSLMRRGDLPSGDAEAGTYAGKGKDKMQAGTELKVLESGPSTSSASAASGSSGKKPVRPAYRSVRFSSGPDVTEVERPPSLGRGPSSRQSLMSRERSVGSFPAVPDSSTVDAAVPLPALDITAIKSATKSKMKKVIKRKPLPESTNPQGGT